MRPQSAKAKGRRLQQQFRDLLIEELKIHPEDIESRSMGAGGEDLIMARAAREKEGFIREEPRARGQGQVVKGIESSRVGSRTQW